MIAPTTKTMKAVVAKGFGDIDQNIVLCKDWPLPEMNIAPEGYLLIRVLSCALAPGDPRILSGATDYVQLPKDRHPYVIGEPRPVDCQFEYLLGVESHPTTWNLILVGSDNVGVVVVTQEGDGRFSVGDYVVSRFTLPAPVGGCTQYQLVQAKLTALCPKEIPPEIACGLPASAVAAKKVVDDFVKPGNCVLVIGGSGGVGSSVLQYCHPKASFVAAIYQCSATFAIGLERTKRLTIVPPSGGKWRSTKTPPLTWSLIWSMETIGPRVGVVAMRYDAVVNTLLSFPVWPQKYMSMVPVSGNRLVTNFNPATTKFHITSLPH
jgi:hypothetical protein